MPTLISADEFRERFDIDSDIKTTRIEPHIGSASRRLRKWVGDTVYNATLGVAASGQDADSDQVNDLKNAEAHLTFHFAVLGMNTPLSGKGIVLQSRTSEGGREIRQYLPPEDTAKVATAYLELAREIAEPYITAEDESGVQVVTDL